MTLSAPRSRQSWFALALALVAVTAALAVGLLWSSNEASADPPAPNDVTVTATDDIAADPILPGTVVTYTFAIDAPSGSVAPTNDTYFYAAVDPNILITSVTSGAGGVFQAGECSSFSDTEIECVDTLGPLTSDVVTVTGIVLNRIDFFVFSPFCEVGDDYFSDSGGVPVRLGDQRNVFAICDTTATSCDGLGGCDIVEAAAPQDATNAPNNSHVVTFVLQPGFVCNSDPIVNDGFRDCDGLGAVANQCTYVGANPDQDVCLDNNSAGATITNVDFSDCPFFGFAPGNFLNATCTIIVTINAPGPGDVDILLGHKFDPQTGRGHIDLVPMIAEKTFAAAAAVGGELQHFDISDRYSEDAAGFVDGLLDDQSDIDDATGSFHAACITDTLLTDLNNPDITWTITNHAGGSTTVDPPPAGQKIAGPINPVTGLPYPCVRWGSGGVGTQSITATYDDGVTPPETFYWDNVNALPLIKEWNDLDETHIVRATGDIDCVGPITAVACSNLGDPEIDNTLEMDDWAQRDCSFIPVNAGFCTRPNQDGLNIQAAGGLLAASPNPPFTPVVLANGVSFIDYTFGSHSTSGGAYNGPVDGALQTYTISGGCGAVRLEDPSDLDGDGEVVEILFPGDAQDVLSSDKGVGFEVVPNDDGAIATNPGNANCAPGDSVTVTIATQEQFLFHSPPIRTVTTETVTVTFTSGPLGVVAPYLAWVGQRVVVEHDWGTYDAAGNHVCPDFDAATGADANEFGVFYSVENNGPGAFSSFLAYNEPGNDIDENGRDARVDVDFAPVPAIGINRPAPNSDCISRIIYSSAQPGRVDIVSYPTDDDDDLSNADPRGNPTHFTIYFMKFEDISLSIVSTTASATADATANVSDSVAATLTVRGYSDDPYGDCDVKAAGTDPNGAATPANRCIFPDDWPDLGGVPGLTLHPELDIETSTGWATAKCLPDPRSAGPYSWLENTATNSATAAPVCGDSNAPHVAGAFACKSAAQVPCRETVFPDRLLNAKDAPMPPSLARFLLTGSGFLTGATKGASQFQFTHIPAEPWITPTNPFTLGGYMWNTWGASGPKTGIYTFWTSVADQGPEVVSCPGVTNAACAPVGTPLLPCASPPVVAPPTGLGCLSGGYKTISVYTDNDGVAVVTVNGDADLTFDGCTQTPGTNNTVFINGFYCNSQDPDPIVGTSTLTATADYPDARPHPPVAANAVTVDWTWAGTKEVTVEPGVPGQFHYIVFHVTDRDGTCGGSFHPTLGEQVNFTIDSATGIIVPNQNGDSAWALGSVAAGGKSAITFTFDTTGGTDVDAGGKVVQPVVVDGECQAWIHVSESLLNAVNVIVTAFDPEGTITFDVVTPTPTPTPSPSPSPTPTPAPSGTPWGDVDCDGDVDSIDALAVLDFVAHLPFNQTGPCHALDAGVTVDGTPGLFGDIDCDGDVTAVDALAILLGISNLPAVPHSGCPDVLDLVTIV